VRILVQGFQVSIPIAMGRCRANRQPYIRASTLCGWLSGLGLHHGASLVHAWAFWLYHVLAPCARRGLITPYTHLTAPPSPHRMKSSPSPSSPGHGWGAGFSTAALSMMARSWCWSGCQLSSTAPCTAALPRTPWAPPTPTPVSLFSVRQHYGGDPFLHKSSLISPPSKTVSLLFLSH